jgi:hypothetical protein
MDARIELTHPNGHREQRTLGLGRYRVGREGVEIVLSDPNVSSVHAELIVEPGRLMLADLGSRNGTFGPDGQRISAPIFLYAGQAARLAGSGLALLEPPRAATGTQEMPRFSEVGTEVAQAGSAAAPHWARGTVIKVPDGTPGLLMIEGNQVQFHVTNTWKSSVAPALNQTLDVELDARGEVLSLSVVDGQRLAKERLEAAASAAGHHGKKAAEAAKRVVSNTSGTTALISAAAGVAALGLVGIGWWLFGGDLSEGKLAAKLDERLEETGVKACWNFTGGSTLTFPVRLNNMMGEVSKNPIAKGLLNGGYITLTPERMLPGASVFDDLGRAHQLVLDVTPKGKSEGVWNAGHGFCVGRRAVDSVDRWTEPANTNGVQAIQIDYKWKIVDRPSWASDDLFSDVPGREETGRIPSRGAEDE